LVSKYNNKLKDAESISQLEFKQFRDKIGALDTKIDSLNPLTEISVNNDERLMGKISNIKKSLNDMNNSFEDVYSRKVYKNLKEELIHLQIQLIEGKNNQQPKETREEGSSYLKDRLDLKVKTLSSEFRNTQMAFDDVKLKSNRLDKQSNELADEMNN